jgi:hypothetical protein
MEYSFRKIKPIHRKKKSSLSPVLHTHPDDLRATGVFCGIIAADQDQSVVAKR